MPWLVPLADDFGARNGYDVEARMPAMVVSLGQAEFLTLDLCLPGRMTVPLGILLHERARDRLHVKLRRDWLEIAPVEDVEVLRELPGHLERLSRELGAAGALDLFEDSLSNVLRVSSREAVVMDRPEATLERLYRRLVPATVLRYDTHLPMYSARVAAGRLDREHEVEPEEWVETPDDLRLTEDLFVARVEGRSMEPKIPDGSLCVFRWNATGSRQNRLVLVTEPSDMHSGGRLVVKRYRSEKRILTGEFDDDSFEHVGIVLESLNPAFPPIHLEADERRYRVLADFVRVL